LEMYGGEPPKSAWCRGVASARCMMA
jgi:hypothetical protein